MSCGLARRGRVALLSGALLALASAAGSIETDQYFTWGRTLEDSTDFLNARVNVEIERLLETVNGRKDPSRLTCDDLRAGFNRRFRMLIFNQLEIWAVNSPLVSRIPAGADEIRQYRRRYLYHESSALDTGTWMPPSPTVLVNGVRIGTDKLTHLVGTSWYYHRWYQKARRKGLSPEEALRRTLLRGLQVENTILGKAVSGVISQGDLEANYHGMVFFNEFCEGDDPTLRLEAGGWRLARRFDLRRYVTPEWDESYQPSIFTKSRWKKVRPVLLQYCDKLDDPGVAAMRQAYRERDRITLTETLVGEMVAEGELDDPASFAIEHVCAEAEASGELTHLRVGRRPLVATGGGPSLAPDG